MRWLFLLLFALVLSGAAAAVQYSLCGAGCDFSSLQEALENVTGTADTLLINGSGTYYATGPAGFTINGTADPGIVINSSDVVVDCNSSNITGYGYGFYLAGENITVQGCNLMAYTRCIHLEFSRSAYLRSNSMSNCSYGMFFNGANSTVVQSCSVSSASVSAVTFANNAVGNLLLDTTIFDSAQDISSSDTGTSNYALNCTFDPARATDFTSDAELYVQWHVRGHVNDSYGADVEAAAVNISDAHGSMLYSLSTDASGMTLWKNLTEYRRNATGDFTFTNFTFFAYNATAFHNRSVNVSYSQTVPLTFDLTPPVIANVQNVSTNSSALIAWETDDLSNSSVAWGDACDNLSSTSYNSSWVTEHYIAIHGLTELTSYCYNVSSCNDQGYCSESGPYPFTTEASDKIPPVITIAYPANASNLSSNTVWVNVSLSTDEEAVCVYHTGPDFNFTEGTVLNGSDSTHWFNYTGLTSATSYDVYYLCNDTYGNVNNRSLHHSFDVLPVANLSLTVFVNDSLGSPIEGVNLTITDTSVVCSNLTNSTGYAAAILPEYVEYGLRLTKAGYVGVETAHLLAAPVTLNFTLQNQTGIMPQAAKFLGTDFGLIEDLTNVTGLNLSTADASVLFNGSLNVSGLDLDSFINMSTGLVSIDTENLPSLNVSASLAMHNVACPVNHIYYSPVHTENRGLVYAAGVDCEAAGMCSGRTCTGTTLFFNVSSFSSFAAGMHANLTVWDDTDSMTIYPFQQVVFYASYTNGTDPANGTCAITIAGSEAEYMGYNGSLHLHSQSLNASGIFNYTIICNGSLLGYDILNATDTLNISMDTTAPVLSNRLNTSTNATAEYTFDTDDYSNATLSYGLSPGLGSAELSTVFLQNHSITVTGLNETTLYYYNITVCNSDGYCAEYGTYNLTTQNSTDYTPPDVISLVNTTTNQSAEINFTTDDPANMTISYGVSAALGSTLSNSTLATSHSALITGLINNTMYYYNITVCNLYRYCNETGPYTFTTDQTIDYSPPVISSLVNTSTNESAAISFQTDDASNRTISYGMTSALGSSYKNSTFYNVHVTSLSGLASNTTYYYNVSVCNEASLCTDAGPYSFTTLATPDSTAPIISNVRNNTVTNVSAVITWTTNEAATSRVKYGTSSGTYTSSSTGSSYTTSHSRTLTGLTTETTYYYVVNSTDASGNSRESSERSFTTPDSTPPAISSVSSSGITGSAAQISWTTDEEANSLVRYGTSSGSYPYRKYTSGFFTNHTLQLTGLSESATYYYRVYSNDSSGNAAQSSQGSFTTLDTTAPSITFSAPTNRSTLSDSINIQLTVTTNEAATCTVTSHKVGSGITTTDTVLTAASSNTSHGYRFNATAEASGYDFYFTVECIDASENSRESTVYFALNDTTAPTASFVSPTPADGAYSNTKNMTVKLRVNEAQASGFPKVSVDGAANATMSSSGSYYLHTATGLAEGSHSYTVYLSDAYSNLRSYTRTLVVDSATPRVLEIYPDEDERIADCPGLVVNVTLDEEADCTYSVSIEQTARYDRCIGKCEDTQEDCEDDAEDAGDREECQDDYDDCEGDCEEARYRELYSGSLDEQSELADCEDQCDDDETDCTAACRTERSACLADASDADDRADCADEYDGCREDCGDERDDCYDECDTGDYIYVESFSDKCLDDGNYLMNLTCEDNASNTLSHNVSFIMSDTTAPSIISAAPNGTLTTSSAELRLTTSEPARCRASESNVAYGLMELGFGSASRTHRLTVSGLKSGDHTYYVLCNDTKGNMMTSPGQISFKVSVTESRTAASKAFGTVSAGDTAELVISGKDMAVISIAIAVTEEVAGAVVDVRKLDTVSVRKPSGAVYEYFEIIKDGISNKQISRVTIEFKVAKSWLVAENLGADEIELLKYTTEWEPLATRKISEDGTNAYYSAETTDFSLFAIAGNGVQDEAAAAPAPSGGIQEPEPEEDTPADVPAEKAGSWLWILILCVVVVGGGSAVFYVYRSHRHPQQDSSAEAHIQPTHVAAGGEVSHSSEGPSAAASYSPDDELATYIAGCLQKGIGLESIKKALAGNGYSDDAVNAKLIEMGLVDELGTYIRQALAAGQSLEDVKRTLVEAGYGPQDVVNKFSDMQLTEDHGQDEEITGYIRQAFEAGMPAESVRQSLVDAGHDASRVDELMQKIALQPVEAVVDYAKASLDSGMSTEAVKENLEDMGYDAGYVDQVSQPQEADHELREYVQLAAKSGHSRDEIERSLLEAGHGDGDVQRVLDEILPVSYVAEPAAGQVANVPAGSQQAGQDAGAKSETGSGQAKSSTRDDVMDYIRKGLEDSVPRRLIRAALMKSGHSKKDINRHFAQIDAAQKKLEKDLKEYYKRGKKQGQTKKEIREALIDMGMDSKAVKKVLGF